MKKQLLPALAVLLCVATTAEAQFTYDWSTGSRTEETRLQAGRRNEIVVSGLNPLCYTSHVRLTTTDAKVDFGGFAASLSAPAKSSPSEAQPPSPLLGLKALNAADAISKAAAYTEAASRRINRVKSAFDELETFAETLADPPCRLGRGWSLEAFQARWDSRRVHLQSVVAAADTALDSASEYLRAAEANLEGLDRETILNPAEQRHLDSLGTQLDQLPATLTATRQRIDAAKDTLENVSVSMGALRARHTIRNVVHFGHDVERVRLVITTTPIHGTNAPAVPADTVEEDVVRRFRLFVSTGMFVSLMRQRDYERTNRPVLRDSTTADGGTVRVPTDSIYSTYVNRRAGLGDIVSPTLQLNMVFKDLFYQGSGFPVMASFGAAARSVNGSTLPEPFAGFSLGINDRIVFGGGFHYGRNEELLLTLPGEAPEDVAERRIPTGISTDDAVGLKWRFARYLTISVKL